MALKELDRPITGSVTFRTRMKAVSSADGLLSNGYLAFGNGTTDTKLIKCGVRLKAKQVSIVQGPLLKGKSSTAKINANNNQSVEIIVKVNLRTKKIIYTANGVMMEAQIQRPLQSITHVGYVINSALIDFAPVEVNAQ
jgi:hypothetical protein